jgi:curved DNA-binding protein CbpA
MKFFIDYYEILGVDQKASETEIKKAFRNKTKMYHPDVGGKNEEMTLVIEAYETLRNPIFRKDYDRMYEKYKPLFKTETKYEERDNRKDEISGDENVHNDGQVSSMSVVPDEKTSNVMTVLFQPYRKFVISASLLIVVIAIFYLIFWTSENENDGQKSSDYVYDSSVTISKSKETNKNTKAEIYTQLETSDSISENKQKIKQEQPETNSTAQNKLSNNQSNSASVIEGEQILKQYISVGSTKEEVKAAMGIPTSIDDLDYLDTWWYGYSYVSFEYDKVKGWNNSEGNLKLEYSKVENKSFTVGSTKKEVKAAMGTPTSIDDLDYLDTWWYGYSYVSFKYDKVKGWNNSAGNLKLAQSTVKNITFTIGSSKEEVKAAMGTPTSIDDLDYLDTWWYGYSYVSFEYDKVKGWNNSAGNLKVR